MRVAVLGAGGMLGHDVVDRCHEDAVECTPLNSAEGDVTDPLKLARAVPVCDWVINCASYTRVDDAESNVEQARRINRDGAGHIAELCARRGISLLHVSTDYVFDGCKQDGYVEMDSIHPLSVYGETKVEGEQAIRESGCRAITMRTQALFGAHGSSFVKTIAERITTSGDTLKVVSDQVTSPTYTVHLAQAIMRLLTCGKHGIVHVAATGACTWHDLACAIVARVKPGHPVEPVTSDAYQTPARRPPNATLNTTRFERWTGWTMPPWQQGVEGFLAEAGLGKAAITESVNQAETSQGGE